MSVQLLNATKFFQKLLIKNMVIFNVGGGTRQLVYVYLDLAVKNLR